MKKKIVLNLLILAILSVFVGCTKKVTGEKIVGGWDSKVIVSATIPEEAKSTFESAIKDYGKKYEAVALLGTQVVAGTNYMYLCKDNNNYKVIVVYKNTEGKSSVTHDNAFNLMNYVNEEKSYTDFDLVGGWNAYKYETGTSLDSEIQSAYDEALTKVQGMKYVPLAVLGKQLVSGTNYALLCYGEVSISNPNSGMYIVTLYKDLEGTAEFVSSYYLDLAEFNK